MALIRERRLVALVREADVYLARETAAEMADAAGFDGYACSDIETAVSEVCANVLRHAHRGYASLRVAPTGFTAVVNDEGPGFGAEPPPPRPGARAGLGVGLAGAERLMGELVVRSSEVGSEVVIHRPLGPKEVTEADDWVVDAVSRARQGRPTSGDRFWAGGGPDLTMVVADGLGSGERAAEAARAVTQAVAASPPAAPLAESVEAAHRAARAGRGAVAIFARLRPAIGVVEYAGVGDVTGWVEPIRARLSAQPGVLGLEIPVIRVSEVPLADGTRLTLWTDGVRPHIAEIAGGPEHGDPGDWAERIVLDHGSDRDDALVVTAARVGRPAG